jgi:hypothetical protein
MFGSKTILIFDANGYASFDLSEAIEESDGCVAGPVATLSEALIILDSVDIGGAIVDCDLAEASDVVMLLSERDIPLVVQVCSSPERSLDEFDDKGSVLMRPVDPRTILKSLLVEIGKSEWRASNKLGSVPKEV